MQITSGDMPMLSDLQLVYMGPRNSTELLKINTTKFQVEREPVYLMSRFKNSYQCYSEADSEADSKAAEADCEAYWEVATTAYLRSLTTCLYVTSHSSHPKTTVQTLNAKVTLIW